jgi:hypothetical protein
MSSVLSLRVFVSSPGDVGSERAVALAVIERLQLEFRGFVQLEAFLWERSVLRATDTFQAQILDIQRADLALFILWARMGTPLPSDHFHRSDGSQYNSGTEYEFERAREGYEKNRSPDILCYLKTAEFRLSMKDRTVRAQQVAELDAVSQFVDKWFRNLDGTFKSAFYNFEKTAQFEDLIEVHIRDWIRQRLPSTAPTSAIESMWKGSPFRGLQPFEFGHALIYCGRTGMVSEILDVLRRRGADGRGFLMVTGVSGVGKSSLVKAGVLPTLTRPRVVEQVLAWRRTIFKPNVGDQSLLASFAAALVEKDALPELTEEGIQVEKLLLDPAALATSLSSALDRAARHAREVSPDPDPKGEVRLVVVVDQFEEVFDETVTAAERAAFADALRTMALSGRVWVIATLRADFFSRCAELPERFRDLYVERGGMFTVGGPRPAEIAQMIRRPAMMAGLTFERRGDPEEGLDDVLRDAASGNPTVLPLLEFTLDELWRRSAGSGVLRFIDYEKLGGLHGALRLRADEEFGRLSGPVKASLPKVLAALVHTDPTDERLILQNRASLAQFSGSPECKALIDAFVSAHLFVGDRAADGTPVIGMAHEALLREWPPAVEWVEQNRETLRLRAGIAAEAALWRNSDFQENRLLVGVLLRDAAKLLSTNPEMLTSEERRFIDLSIRGKRQRQRTRAYIFAVAATAITLAILIPTIGLNQIFYRIAFARTIPAVWNAQRQIPVSHAALDNLRASVKALSLHLRPMVAEMGHRPELNPWAIAQIWLALDQLDPELANRGKDLRAFMTAHRDPDCNCWRETEDKLPHTVASAWVMYALAQYQQAATPEEIDSVLKRQVRQGSLGWWTMFPATPDEKNASTSATAWTMFALHQQLAHHLVAPEQRPEVFEAIQRGATWLAKRARPNQARWAEYSSADQTETGEEYLAVSALVVHVLRNVEPSMQLDSLWLRDLPQQVPAPNRSEISKGLVFRSKTQVTLDEVRHYRFPWMLRATVDSYANGSVTQRARAALWVEEAFKHPLTAETLHSEYWTIAEVLFALRDVQAKLDLH